jgi:hypothetical protein
MGKKSNALLSGAGNLSNGTLGGNSHGYGPMTSGMQGFMQTGSGQGSQNLSSGFTGNYKQQ